ncbi:MAG: hypothetical protein LWY06_06150 [Firmicutes bacterium]|nr:hypothetical protein [Bacillota bacterium]
MVRFALIPKLWGFWGILPPIANLFENCEADFKKVKIKKCNESRYKKDNIPKERK